MADALNEAFLRKMEELDSPESRAAADAVAAFMRRKMTVLDYIPMRYYIHPDNALALKRLYAEIDVHGEIKLSSNGIPQCLVDEGIDSVESGDPRWSSK